MDTTNSIQSNPSLTLKSGPLNATPAIPPAQLNQEQPNGLQQPLRSDEREPQISLDGSRLAAVANDNDRDDRVPAITNSQEAQQAINQLREDIQSNPGQANQTQKISAESVRALISA